MMEIKTEGREICLKVLTGSHNYNLNTPKSDEDYKYFVIPSFDDLYYGKMYSYGEQSAECDYTVHDIRKLPELLWKANLNFIEILYSVKRTNNADLNFLFQNADIYSTMNLFVFYKATIGMSNEKMKNLYKGTETTKSDVEKYGYDVKQASHALRCLYTVSRFYESMDMGHALWYDDNDPQRNILISLKNGEYTEEKFRLLMKDWHDKYGYKMESFYHGLYTFEDTYNVLSNKIKENIHRRYS